MKSCEKFIRSDSDYYNYSPSIDGQNTFFYPICTGHFVYEAGYHQHRNSYDSFLLMYIKQGELQVNMADHSEAAHSDQFVLLDCYRPHGYCSASGCEIYWFHFDGPTARRYYEMIHSHLGTVFSIRDSQSVINIMLKIYQTFRDGNTIREAMLSKQISDILTAFILYNPAESRSNTQTISMEEIVSYITEHFMENLSIDVLADRAMLSPYHFIRIFKKETGFTPHEYLINTRIANAKYLLKTSQMNIKDICFSCGFFSESVFCTSFKKNIGMTPADFRRHSE